MNDSEHAALRGLCRGESPDVVARLVVGGTLSVPAGDTLLLARWAVGTGEIEMGRALCMICLKVSRNILEEAIDLLQEVE